jgi:hypothetical protein
MITESEIKSYTVDIPADIQKLKGERPCSSALKREIRRAIHAIHEEDDYDKGMAILCKLADIKVKARKFITATPAECVPPNADISDGKNL